MAIDNLAYIEYRKEVHETHQAKLFDIEGYEVWLPKSQIEDQDEEEKIVAIPEWLADKHNLESKW